MRTGRGGRRRAQYNHQRRQPRAAAEAGAADDRQRIVSRRAGVCADQAQSDASTVPRRLGAQIGTRRTRHRRLKF